jgi:hypothetical protein
MDINSTDNGSVVFFRIFVIQVSYKGNGSVVSLVNIHSRLKMVVRPKHVVKTTNIGCLDGNLLLWSHTCNRMQTPQGKSNTYGGT